MLNKPKTERNDFGFVGSHLRVLGAGAVGLQDNASARGVMQTSLNRISQFGFLSPVSVKALSVGLDVLGAAVRHKAPEANAAPTIAVSERPKANRSGPKPGEYTH